MMKWPNADTTRRFVVVSAIYGALLLGIVTCLPLQPLHADSAKDCVPHFEGKLSVTMNDDGRSMRLTEPYMFVDDDCSQWHVPAQATIDGASIPRPLWGIVGGPYEGAYRNASVIHDWFCARRLRTWQAVDLMFYHAMLASNVSKSQAKIMYLAVYYAGPRWDQLTIQNENLPSTAESDRTEQATGQLIVLAPSSIDIHEFELMAQRVRSEDSSLSDIRNMSDDRQRFVRVSN
jgi:hypothetical protein